MARIVKGASKATKSDSVTVRLDPKLRYLADVAARSQRRSLSAFIEWSVELALQGVQIRDTDGLSISAYDLGSFIWDVDESDRFVRLAIHAVDLLTYEEQKIWKLIQQYQYAFLIDPFNPKLFQYESNIDFKAIRENWSLIQSACSNDDNSDESLKILLELDSKSKIKKVDDDDILF